MIRKIPRQDSLWCVAVYCLNSDVYKTISPVVIDLVFGWVSLSWLVERLCDLRNACVLSYARLSKCRHSLSRIEYYSFHYGIADYSLSVIAL